MTVRETTNHGVGSGCDAASPASSVAWKPLGLVEPGPGQLWPGASIEGTGSTTTYHLLLGPEHCVPELRAVATFCRLRAQFSDVQTSPGLLSAFLAVLQVGNALCSLRCISGRGSRPDGRVRRREGQLSVSSC